MISTSSSRSIHTFAEGTALRIALAISSVKARGESVSANAAAKKPATNTNAPITRFTCRPLHAATMESVSGSVEQIKNKYVAAEEKIGGQSPPIAFESNADVTARGGTCRP